MRNLRLTPLIVSIIGTLLCIIAPVLIFFLMIKPTDDQIATQQATYDANSSSLGPIPLNNAKKGLQTAKDSLAEAQTEWDTTLRTKNPVIDQADRFVAWKQYWTEMEYTLGPLVQKFWMKDIQGPHRNANGVIALGTVSLPAPSSDPNSVTGAVLTIPLKMVPWPAPATGTGGGGGSTGGSGGDIQVLGTFQAGLNHIQSWNNFSRLVQIDDVALSGYSPFITTSYDATIYEFMRNSDKPGTAVPSGGTTPGK
jgi:hypothetical protein